MRSGRTGALRAGAVAMVLMAFLAFTAWAETPGEQVAQVTAKKFEFSPGKITVKKDTPVVLQFRSLDRLHGFNCPGLKIRADIPPGKTTELRFVPRKAGVFPFHCDVFCGSGHDHMEGVIAVTE
jgi:cytochrome c oxidase subunit II